ncbi:MAG: PTS sugar transporter subunit IIA [Pseudomonadota bacterium]
MDLTSLLRPEAVRVSSSFSSKKRLFQEMGEMSAAVYGIDATTVVESLLNRESLGPTGVGEGIALPHARLAGVDKVVGLFVRCEKPFEFGAVDRKPVDLVFGLLAPEGAGVEHLKALALVSRTMRNSPLCDKLRANSDPSTLHALLSAAQHSQAA